VSGETVFIPPERRPSTGRFVPPLLIVPFVLYNILAFTLMGGNPGAWGGPIMAIYMVSGAPWAISWGDLLLMLGIVLLFFEVLKSTRTGRSSILEHMLSVGVFVLFLIEFLLVGAAASSVFFILMLMSLIDVIGGFTVSITSAGRDVNLG
jgi:hypothetical protein